MKIALVGAQGVGKSTLAKTLADKRQGAMVPEVARECPYPIDTKANFQTEWWMVAHAILAERDARAIIGPGKLLVADRCVLDIAVYAKLVHELDPGRVSAAELAFIHQTIKQWLAIEPYDHLFLIEVDEEVWKSRDLNDGFRSLDLDWYRKLSRSFREALTLVPPRTELHILQNNGSFHLMVQEADLLVP